MADQGTLVPSTNRKRRRGKETEPAPPMASPNSSSYFSRSLPACGVERLGFSFFNQPCEQLARAMLGQTLVRRVPGVEGALRARVVESEAYPGGLDEASHSRHGRRTPRNVAMFMPPGTLYVYRIYGLHCCLNVSSRGEGSAVLLRALQPLEGVATMRLLRQKPQQASTKCGRGQLPDRKLCNGPGKLCQALSISCALDRTDAASEDSELWFERGEGDVGEESMVAARRVGITSAGDWAERPWRFYIRGNECVSVVDKTAEQLALRVTQKQDTGDQG
ncbi:DNA-3-methyladenine glycosylase isoform X2 [Petromyzon marinus]|nr:DNA-3-methyladenine glycosylase isoform X1 [Petromyzon marinus]XP_032832056.1 DNA-3-methyladenine glycosylase isoform X1 [Petromyzon marinus]